MPELTIRGLLTPDPHLAPYTWHTSDGIETTVAGDQVEVRWATAPDDVQAGFDRMQREVSDRVLLEGLEAVMPMSVQWNEHAEKYEGKTFSIFAPTVTIGWNARRPWQPLGPGEARDLIVAGREEVRVAIHHFRQAIRAWGGDMTETMSRFYLAVEGLVLELRGNSAQGDWSQFAAAIGMSGRRGLQLYCSLQSGRHINAQRAAQALAAAGLPALNPGDCLDLTRELLLAYIDHRIENR